ncbi:MAG: hypothetical protein ACRDS0_11865 [Pseudonocardiaceae bacterium]
MNSWRPSMVVLAIIPPVSSAWARVAGMYGGDPLAGPGDVPAWVLSRPGAGPEREVAAVVSPLESAGLVLVGCVGIRVAHPGVLQRVVAGGAWPPALVREGRGRMCGHNALAAQRDFMAGPCNCFSGHRGIP